MPKDKKIIEFTPNGYVMEGEDLKTLLATIDTGDVKVVCLEIWPDDKHMILRLENVWAHIDFKDKTILEKP